MIIDALYKRVEERGPVCVGLDTKLDYIPDFIQGSTGERLYLFNKMIIDATCEVAAIFKLQIAYYEAYGIEGMTAYKNTIAYLREKEQLIIGDVKRGDIAQTAGMYAKAHFEGDFAVDFITLNPYMGFDTIEPYLPYVKTGEKGLFILCRTSNPGAEDLQSLVTDGKMLYETVAEGVEKIAQEIMGECGYSNIGLVFGGTQSEDIEKIRERYQSLYFLIPGYGAQGAQAADARKYLKDGNGGIVNSSRGIITAFRDVEDSEKAIRTCSYDAARAMREDLGFEEGN